MGGYVVVGVGGGGGSGGGGGCFYIALFSALEQTHCARSAFLNVHGSGVLTALAWLLPHETAAISARSVYPVHPCTMSLHAEKATYITYMRV